MLRGLALNTEGIYQGLLTQWWHNPAGYSCGLSAQMLSRWALGETLEVPLDVLHLLIVLGFGKGLTCGRRAAEKCTTTVKNLLQTKPAKTANKFKSDTCLQTLEILPLGRAEHGSACFHLWVPGVVARVDAEAVVAPSACWQLRFPPNKSMNK